MRLVPTVLDVIDLLAGADASRNRPGITGVNATGGSIEVALIPSEVRRDRRRRLW